METEKREGTVFKAAREIHSLVEQAKVEHIGTGTGVAILLAKGIAGQTRRPAVTSSTTGKVCGRICNNNNGNSKQKKLNRPIRQGIGW